MAIDPRKLKPGELARLLNSTPLGEVISERQLHRHRTRAGFRVAADGDPLAFEVVDRGPADSVGVRLIEIRPVDAPDIVGFEDLGIHREMVNARPVYHVLSGPTANNIFLSFRT